MKTYLAPVNEIERKWYVVDAEDKILGRLATEIASRLRGKHKPTFSPFIDNGDFIACFSNTADVTDAKERHEEKVAAQRRKETYKINNAAK